jgi:hypothetical protein
MRPEFAVTFGYEGASDCAFMAFAAAAYRVDVYVIDLSTDEELAPEPR